MLDRKKVKLIIWIVIVALVLVTCTAGRRYSLSYPEENITSIQICEFHDDLESACQLLPEYTVLCTLDPAQVPQFLDQLYSLKYREYWNDPSNTVRDYGILIQYDNGTREALSTTGCGLFYGDDWDYNWIYYEDEVLYPFLSRYCASIPAN